MNNFIFGILFALVIIPIADGITSLVLSFFEMIKSYISVKIAKCNQKIQNSVVQDDRRVIGFAIPDDDNEEEEEDETDDI